MVNSGKLEQRIAKNAMHFSTVYIHACLVLLCTRSPPLGVWTERGKLLDTADRQLRADCAAASGGCRRVKACLKNVYAGCFCNRRWQHVPLWNSSWEKGLPVRLRVSTYSAVFITMGSAGAGVCTEKNIFCWHSQQTEYNFLKESKA